MFTESTTSSTNVDVKLTLELGRCEYQSCTRVGSTRGSGRVGSTRKKMDPLWTTLNIEYDRRWTGKFMRIGESRHF